ncbi:hypothetical protein CK203_047527 [Vitis vinifera]|uniref:Uncharacterized protein n=1 Tax=Vitis vinifera TaxID=29760 RepID=A0A438GWY4_VITVI|nr:hypothetical protein CK203_047527 [Vitis vinifera]
MISRSDSLCFLTSGEANRETRGETCTLTYLNFEEIYDFEKFIRSLGVVVRVAKDLPAEVSTGELKAVWVLNRASEDYMAARLNRNGSLYSWRLRALSPKSDGLFIAVDLKLEVLEQECQGREATGQKKLL